MENEKKLYTIHFFWLAILVILLVIFFIFWRNAKSLKSSQISLKKKSESVKQIPTLTIPVLPGRFKLKTADDSFSYSVEEPINIDLYINTKNIPIIGFDLVLIYDPTRLKFDQTKSLDSDFSVSAFRSADKLSITGYQKSMKSTGKVINENKVLTLQFQPLKQGKADLKLDFKPGKSSDSNITSHEYKDILGAGEDISFNIGEKVILSLNQVKKTKTDLQLSLTDLNIPEGQCIDCFIEVKVEFVKEKAKKIETFETGGIAGVVKLQKDIFGNHIDIKKITESGVEIIVTGLK